MLLRTILIAALAVTASQGKRHRRVKVESDGEFANFVEAVPVVTVEESVHLSAHDAHVETHVLEDGVPFDPRLPDPPCAWTTWSACDAACGGGSAYRLRRITDECEYGPAEQLKVCNVQPCPSDCVLGYWSEWGCGDSGCSVPCGGGQRTRTRPVTSPALFGGRCDTPLSQTESCNEQACPSDCVATSLWSEWALCDAACGAGRRSRARSTAFVTVVRVGEDQSQAQCPDSVQDEPCGAPCPIDCRLSEYGWSQWSVCSTTCGDFGTQTRHRGVEQYPQNGGNDCPHVLEIRGCENELPACPVQTPPEHYAVADASSFHTFRGEPIILPPLQISLPRVIQTTTELSVDPTFCRDKPDGPYEHPDCSCCNDLIMCFQRSPILKWCPPGEVHTPFLF